MQPMTLARVSATPKSVRLVDVPARLFIESQNHQQDVIRELALIDIAHRFHDHAERPPERVAALIRDILHEYSQVRSVTRGQALQALSQGAHTVTLVVPVSDGIVDALERWLLLVEEADALCADGEFLTMPASPQVAALRRWYAAAIADAVAEGGEQPQRSYRSVDV